MTSSQQPLIQTEWMRPADLLPYLEVGDLVEFRRSVYHHWAVYVGEEDGIKMLIHFSTDDGDGLSTKTELRTKLFHGSTAHVRADPFVVVSGNSEQARVNNYLDYTYAPYPPVIIKDRAMKKLGTSGYNLIFNNCERFCKWARYGRQESDQVSSAVSVVLPVGAFALSGSLAIAGGIGIAYVGAVYVGRRFIHRFIPTGII